MRLALSRLVLCSSVSQVIFICMMARRRREMGFSEPGARLIMSAAPEPLYSALKIS
jgi:hypothetical protein